MLLTDLRKKLKLTPTCSGTFAGNWLTDSSEECIESISPIDGQSLGKISKTNSKHFEQVTKSAQETFLRWRNFPAPKRGEVIRQFGELLRQHKSELAHLITLETGKILPEGEGEVQEMIDIADFALGLSRQLYGLTMHSERSAHRMYEQWHPLGPIGVITAFNFPAAVWAWNALIGAVCGNVIVWKASERTPLVACAITSLASTVAERHGFPGLFSLITGEGRDLGNILANDRRFPLISATGSCQMGRSVSAAVSSRLGRSLLELGGNNAIIVMDDANLDLALRSVLFGALGTAGQRCTSTRRILLHKKIQDRFLEKLLAAYQQVRVGDPRESGVLMGPLIHSSSVMAFEKALARAKSEGGKILCGGKVLKEQPSALYVEPTILLADRKMPLIQEETFAPILYVIPVANLEEAIEIQNEVPQGLSSAIFSESLRNVETFLSHSGSDCGIANVNIGTSGAEIGGAFGGEKDTGGGRESGSDAWKAYMRRQTVTINWSSELPLAQGIDFSISTNPARKPGK